jgi:hypothetical protein
MHKSSYVIIKWTLIIINWYYINCKLMNELIKGSNTDTIVD